MNDIVGATRTLASCVAGRQAESVEVVRGAPIDDDPAWKRAQLWLDGEAMRVLAESRGEQHAVILGIPVRSQGQGRR